MAESWLVDCVVGKNSGWMVALGESGGGERRRTTHCSGARISLAFIENLNGFDVVSAPAEFGR